MGVSKDAGTNWGDRLVRNIKFNFLIMVVSFLILFPILGCISKKVDNIIELGDINQTKAWVYLCGLTQDFYTDQELINRKILDRVGLKTNTKIIAIQPQNRCFEFENKLCWPHNNIEDIELTYKYIMKSVEKYRIAGFIGFSNGAFFLNRLIQHKELGVPIISIGGAGYIESDNYKNVMYVIIGKQDLNHYKHVQIMKTQVQGDSPLNINILEHDGGHEIPEDIFGDLIKKIIISR